MFCFDSRPALRSNCLLDYKALIFNTSLFYLSNFTLFYMIANITDIKIIPSAILSILYIKLNSGHY